MTDYSHWIWLSEALGPNTSASDALFAHFGYDATAIYNADPEDYKKLLSDRQQAKISALLNKDLSEANKILEYCGKNAIGIIPACAKYYYPAQLRRIKNKPVLLYYRGKLQNIESRLNIAMVGTRGITEYGRRLAYTIGYDLAKSGAVVISGMALGIDGISHTGALDGGGYTVAVLGCGVDRAYPNEHTELMERIIQNGIVISEYKPFTPPAGYNFPARNRIISGLSQGCLVVEADVKSGSLITANYAVEQGRRLFAVPGKAGESSSAGTNRLIQEGADMVVSARDILEHFDAVFSDTFDRSTLDSRRRVNILRKSSAPKKVSAAESVPKNEAEVPEKQPADNANTSSDNSKNNSTAQAVSIPTRDPETQLFVFDDSISESQKKQRTLKPAKKAGSSAKKSDEKPAENETGVVDIGLADDKEENEPPKPEYKMDEYEKKIYERSSFTEPISPDTLIDMGMPVARVMIGLTKLEIMGYLKTVSGGKFVRMK